MLDALPPLELAGPGRQLRLSLSVGIAGLSRHDSWSGLMHRADTALYYAKAGGRNLMAIADPVMRDGPSRF